MNPSFLPTITHNKLKHIATSLAVMIIFITLAIVGVYVAGADPRFDQVPTPNNVASAQTKDEPQECPEGYFWRGGCVKVTGCPYGDSIPLGAECDKHAPQNQTSQNMVSVEKPVETVEKVYGK